MDKDLSSIALSFYDYCCPHCGKGSEFFLGNTYEIDGEKYPKIYNEYSFIGHECWDELHKCPDCKKEFWFPNFSCQENGGEPFKDKGSNKTLNIENGKLQHRVAESLELQPRDAKGRFIKKKEI